MATTNDQAATSEGADWPRPVVHWELVARDPARQAAFYSQLFNWHIGSGEIMQIPAGLGGPEAGPAGQIRGGQHPGISLYVQVRALNETVARVEALGGKLLGAPFQTAAGITLCSILDPENNRIVLVQQ